MNFLILIPARGGSKGIPKKNIINLASKPLISYTIEEAIKVKKTFNSEICISTDSVEIAHVSEQFGIKIPFLRPPDISTETATTFSVIQHAIQFYENQNKQFDTIVLLQPTSPFRNAEDIINAINLYITCDKIDMVVGVEEVKDPLFSTFYENKLGFLERPIKTNITDRQNFPKSYKYNGSIYVININSFKNSSSLDFKKIKKFVMNQINSIDIDTLEDLEYCEYLILKKMSKG